MEEINITPGFSAFQVVNTIIFLVIIGFSIYLAVLIIKVLRSYLKKNSKR